MIIHKPVSPTGRGITRLSQSVVSNLGGGAVPASAFLLKEDGDYLLLESSTLVIETGVEAPNAPGLQPPGNFNAEVGGERKAKLGWINRSTGEYTTVIEKASDHKNFKRVVEVAGGVTTYTDDNAEYDETWTYRGKAASAAGHSKYSDEADVTIEEVSLGTITKTTITTGTVDGRDWHGRASMVELGDGTWVLVYRSAPAHDDNGDEVLRIRFSDDKGATWTAEDTKLGGGAVTGFPMTPPGGGTGDASGPGEPWLYLADDGTLILHMWLVDYNVSVGGTYQSTSSDGGETWSTPAVAVDFGGIADDTEVFATDDDFVYGGVIYGGARVWLTSVIPGDPSQSILIKSEDDGATWEKVSVIMDSNEGENASGGQEVGLEYLGDNTIIAMIRDNDAEYSYRRFSTDMGATWGALTNMQPTTVGIAARQRVFTKAYLQGNENWWTDDTLIMVGFIHTNPGSSQGRRNCVWVSRDAGDTWTGPLWLDAETEDAGYGDILYDSATDKYTVITYQGTLAAAALVQYTFAINGL